MIYKIEDTELAEQLFEGWEESIIWSCLQGVMGEVYADRQEHFRSAMAILGDFCFFAGEPEEELIRFKPQSCRQDFIIMVPQNENWAALIEQYYQDKAKKVFRYATKKEQGKFEKEKLQSIAAALPEEYSMKQMDEDLFQACRNSDWSRDLAAQYPDYETYCRLGLGIVILKDGEPVSGASSYSSFRDGIEIEIDTKEPFRRKGLAAACGAKLILECLKRGLYPSWDAQNKASAALAEKLGYRYSHTYPAYEIWGY